LLSLNQGSTENQQLRLIVSKNIDDVKPQYIFTLMVLFCNIIVECNKVV
jgi:hypothetical protein